MLSKLPRKNSNVGKDFYAIFRQAESRLSAGAFEQGIKLAWAIYQEKAQLESEGLRVTHPIDLDFIADLLEVEKQNLLRVLRKELDENADFITTTEVNARLALPNHQSSGFGQGRGSFKPVIKYHLTTQAALNLCMVTRAEKAKALRKFMAAFMDSFVEGMLAKNKQLAAEKRLTPHEDFLVRFATSELAVASLLQRAFSIAGWQMQTEVIYGKESRARADLGYKHFGWWRFYEVKTGTLGLKKVAEEFQHFESNRCSLFKVCRTFTIYSHGFSDDAIIFANSHKQLTLQTFASLRDDLSLRLQGKQSRNLAHIKDMRAELNSCFDSIAFMQ